MGYGLSLLEKTDRTTLDSTPHDKASKLRLLIECKIVSFYVSTLPGVVRMIKYIT